MGELKDKFIVKHSLFNIPDFWVKIFPFTLKSYTDKSDFEKGLLKIVEVTNEDWDENENLGIFIINGFHCTSWTR